MPVEKTSPARLIDHALLAPDLTHEQIIEGLVLARQKRCFAACVHLADVPLASEVLEGSSTGVCAVVGFPLGRQTTLLKAKEAEEAFKKGASELDMVLHIGNLKSGRYKELQEEIQTVAGATPALLKVILETCYLTHEEKITACKIAVAAGAKFVKTSTGFGSGGATIADVALLRKTVGENFGVKAAGGIAYLEVLEQMVEAGANRIGTSRTKEILKKI
ncbi:MAG: deoxyribose-phosphate aldolase [Firmicutes bacterium]|nr:deoxyribose-phosphate aldolase [Bacillota bacterium]